jgi:C_GCAxxG_C_C family probable redox protein
MNDDAFRVLDLAMQGFQCSQILVQISLEAQGKENPELVSAMTGLTGGMGSGKTCGALTGGCCVLGLYAGKSSAEQNADDRLQTMQTRFVEWFETGYTARFGSIECAGIVQDDMRNRMARCPTIVMESLEKLKEILDEHNYEFSNPTPSDQPR